MIEVYLVGVAIFAALYGFNTCRSAYPDGVRLVVTCLGWPIILVAAAGEASRMLNARRAAEDVADEAK